MPHVLEVWFAGRYFTGDWTLLLTVEILECSFSDAFPL